MTTILLGKECSTFLETDESVLQRGDVGLVWAETVDAFVPFGATNQAPAPLEREAVWPSGATADGPPARLSAARTARAETGKSGSSGFSE